MADISMSLDIDETVEAIETEGKLCVKKELEAQLFKAVGEWVANSVKQALEDVFLDLLKDVIKDTVGGGFTLVPESAFQIALGKVLCGQQKSAGVTSTTGNILEFEVRVGNCGDSSNVGQLNCDSEAFAKRGLNGIDLVFAKKLGLELKRNRDTWHADQHVRFCRWGAAQGLHTFLYGFIVFPEDSDQDKYARLCWHCWTDTSAPTCPGGGVVGSIYVGFGVKAAEKSKRHYYIATPDKVCP
jgi:hypothetical protein